jgi:hypothetical protein
MSVRAALDRLTRGPLRRDDDEWLAALEPGLDAAAIDAIAERLGAPLPADLRELLSITQGIDGLELRIDFTGGQGFGLEDVFPHGVAIAHDDTGDAWVVDCITEAEPEAAVFFACHDPPIVLWEGRGLAAFLEELRRSFDCGPDDTPLLDDVETDRLHHVWKTNPQTVDRRTALESVDETVRAFAAALDDAWVVTDLRAAEPGMGFSWGRFGHGTRVRRHGDARLFACAPPERRPGLISRLFGR